MYTVEPCIYDTTRGDVAGYLICSDEDLIETDIFLVNRYLHKMAMGSDQTARQYAYRLLIFINFLRARGKDVLTCTDDDIVRYLHSVQYDMDGDVVSIQQKISPYALGAYYYPVRGLFVYLSLCKIPLNVDIKMISTRNGKNSYLQGIAQTMPVPDLVLEQSFKKGAPSRDYKKWYTPEEKDSLLSAFRTTRDKAITSISLDGFRADEILSSRMCDYDTESGVLTPFRSKRKDDGSELRSHTLSERSVRFIEDYLMFERAEIENELYERGEKIADEIFVVMERGKYYGKALSYHSYWKNLKAAARRAGFDEKKIRTHSGRSTRANEIFSDWAEHPDAWTEREIMDVFGWKSFESATPYINRNDRRRQIVTMEKLKRIDDEMHQRHRKDKGENIDDE